MTRPPLNRLSLLLLATAVGLSYMLVAPFGPASPERFSDPMMTSPEQVNPDKSSFDIARTPDLVDLQQTVARPLFRATRRAPVPQEVVQLQTDLPDRRSYELVGITLFGERRVALIQASGSDRLQRVSEGQRFDRWRVLRIEARRVVIAQGDETRELYLKQDEKNRPRAIQTQTAPGTETLAAKPRTSETPQ